MVGLVMRQVKRVIDHLKQLFQHVVRGRSVGPVNRYLHHLVERVVINAFEVSSIRRA